MLIYSSVQLFNKYYPTLCQHSTRSQRKARWRRGHGHFLLKMDVLGILLSSSSSNPSKTTKTRCKIKEKTPFLWIKVISKPHTTVRHTCWLLHSLDSSAVEQDWRFPPKAPMRRHISHITETTIGRFSKTMGTVECPHENPLQHHKMLEDGQLYQLAISIASQQRDPARGKTNCCFLRTKQEKVNRKYSRVQEIFSERKKYWTI